MTPADQDVIAIWALTPNGAVLARTLAKHLPDSQLFLSTRLGATDEFAMPFTRLADEVDQQFSHFAGHIFIMATGIVVRTIAKHLVHKTSDPAVVVCDETGHFAISLVSGHLGGANRLAQQVAEVIGSQAVITTATDINGVPAIDLIAQQNGLTIENPAAIKAINMALINGDPIAIHDPCGLVAPHLPADQLKTGPPVALAETAAAIFVDHTCEEVAEHVLLLRPPTLVAGMGCNRGTAMAEMQDLLDSTLAANNLSAHSLCALATVDLKADEPGLLALAESLHLSLTTFTRDQLNGVDQVPTPSAAVEKHIGVQSVCEAAAILASNQGRIIVPKTKTQNVTLSLAVDGSISSASAPAAPIT